MKKKILSRTSDAVEVLYILNGCEFRLSGRRVRHPQTGNLSWVGAVSGTFPHCDAPVTIAAQPMKSCKEFLENCEGLLRNRMRKYM